MHDVTVQVGKTQVFAKTESIETNGWQMIAVVAITALFIFTWCVDAATSPPEGGSVLPAGRQEIQELARRSCRIARQKRAVADDEGVGNPKRPREAVRQLHRWQKQFRRTGDPKHLRPEPHEQGVVGSANRVD